MNNHLFLVSGLNPRQGGVQVSALDALAGLSAPPPCVVFGSDPLMVCPAGSLVSTQKWSIVGKLLLRRWEFNTAVYWHLSMLRLNPFLRGFVGRQVCFLHGIETWRPQSAAMVKKLMQVDLFLSNSDFTWRRFLEYVPQVEGHPHITTPLGYGEPIAKLDLAIPKIPSVLIVSRLAKAEDYKGHRELIAAWPKVVSVVPNARLDIVGEGDLKDDLMEATRLHGVQGSVIFHDRVEEAEKESLMSQCSVFAMPSRAEGFGIVYLEAMRYGRPCLVSNCDAGREVVNPPEAGLEVDPKDIEQVSNALIRLLTSTDLWQQMSQSALQRYSQHYTVSEFRRRLWNAVDCVV